MSGLGGSIPGLPGVALMYAPRTTAIAPARLTRSLAATVTAWFACRTCSFDGELGRWVASTGTTAGELVVVRRSEPTEADACPPSSSAARRDRRSLRGRGPSRP